jgi:hypothetical protein
MQSAIEQSVQAVSAIVQTTPIGTNLALGQIRFEPVLPTRRRIHLVKPGQIGNCWGAASDD